MIKSELILNVAKKLNHISERDLTDSINVMLEQMSVALSSGERIEIRGFGSFSLHYRPPRKAHNPKSGERLVTTAKYSPHFKPGKEMRERINESAKSCEIKDDEED
jgi:integration host factor subunit beta